MERTHRALAVVALLAGTALGQGPPASARAGPPAVSKVEPPGWWAGHTVNPVRLLVRGRNLHGARVEGPGHGVSVGLVRVNASGTYAFADVHVAPAARPGAHPLRLTTAGGSTSVPFELLDPLPRSGRFQGLGADDVVYLLMPDRFANGDPGNDDPAASPGLLDRSKARYYHGGDLAGVIARLPYLKDLGVTALWLNPWYDNNDRFNEKEKYDGQAITDYHGYGAVDFYDVEERFGDLATLRRLVEEAHRLGLKVVQDQVANHTGPYHPWVQDPPTPTWFNGTEKNHLANTWQIWTLADPHSPPEVRRATLEGWFIDLLPDLNQDDEETARYVVQNSLWWIGTTGLDAIRQDTWPYVPRRFWRDWMAALKREHPSLTVAGEMWDGDPSLVSFFQGGRAQGDGIDTGVDQLFDFPLFYPLRRAFAEGKPLREVAVMLSHDRLYPDPGGLLTFLGLHDVPRFMNEPGATPEGLKLAFTFLMTARGIPVVYYGDEIALRGGGDPDNRRDFPGGWPGDPRNAFEGSGRTAEEQSVFEHLRRLTRLRAQLAPLRRGRTVNLQVGEQTWAFARRAGDETVIVAFNNGPAEALLEFDAASAGLTDGAELEDRLGARERLRVEVGRVRLRLPARGAAVYAAR
jgi:glycosidase